MSDRSAGHDSMGTTGQCPVSFCLSAFLNDAFCMALKGGKEFSVWQRLAFVRQLLW
jgi:hypothetical protein